jgi:hypothetical protein
MCAEIGKPCHETDQSARVTRRHVGGGGGFAGQSFEQSFVSELERMGDAIAR